MRFHTFYRATDEEGIDRDERELSETSAFIEAQLRTGVLLAATWADELQWKVQAPSAAVQGVAVASAAAAHGRS